MSEQIERTERTEELRDSVRMISECRQSGQQVKAWCIQNGISTSQYYKRREKVFEALLSRAEAQDQPSGQREAIFAELPAPERTGSSGREPEIIATLRAGSGELDVYAGADISAIEALYRVISHAE